uniref:LIM and calponin homology domains 1 n=1 Tax=Tetraodon nigroviridis TaxID=99883 RepID=H3D691_TETNG
WLYAVTGRCFGDRDFRGGLENGILLCELLSSIKPGLVKKINRLQTPIAGLDNLGVFLRGCEEFGLKGSQLFDPGDLQDASTRPTAKGSDCTRKLKNVLITIYWLGRAANGCTSYSGPTLDLKEFEGLLSQMRKEAEETESPKRNIRDSGYIDCWDSERSDSLSPPRHCREDSFDSLDSFGSRSRQTPSPDVLVARGSSDGRGSDSESDGPPHRKMPDVRKDDMSVRRTSVTELRTPLPFNQYLPNKSNQSGYMPTPLRKKMNDKDEGGRKSWSTATSPVGGDRPCRLTGSLHVSDDAQSVSMIDMRAEEETLLQPHSQVRHELMHNQYNKMKEEEDHWQDDLARWKNRRRSISQDLIKKEEERKMMEQLLSGDTCTSVRRRSIKTYREIVADKERREQELRDAYRRARTPEEASSVLQRYAQRFSISEAVLEQLQLPKLLDRSASSPTTPDPFDTDPGGPLRYLRQQSAPAPKFTSTFEAQIQEFSKESSHQRPQIRSRSSEPPAARGLSPKAVPLLMPKPYLQSQPPASEQWPSKAGGLLPINGEMASPSKHWTNNTESAPSATSPICSPHTPTEGETPASARAGKTHGRTETTDVQRSTPPSRPTTLPAELQKPEESSTKTGSGSGAATEEETEKRAERQAPPSGIALCTDVISCVFLPGLERLEDASLSESQRKTRTSAINGKVRSVNASRPSSKPKTSFSIPTISVFPFSSSFPVVNVVLVSLRLCVRAHVDNGPFLIPDETERQGDRWSWDPDEERKRQERWQQEQERMLQDTFVGSYTNLTRVTKRSQNTEKQRLSVSSHQERRILEESRMPLTPRSSGVPTSSRGEASSSSEPHDTIVRSLADWERKQELLERQLSLIGHHRGPAQRTQNTNREQTTGPVTSARLTTAYTDLILTLNMFLTLSSLSQSPCLSETLQNGQKAAPVSTKSSTPVKKPEPTIDGNKQIRPTETRRSVSGKKLCSSCGHPLGKGAAMIIETLSLYFHIHCFKCGVCKGQLGDTTTGTDVRIRNGLLNCHQCYIRSRCCNAGKVLLL